MLRNVVKFAVYGTIGYLAACLLNYAVARYESAQAEKRRGNVLQVLRQQQENIEEIKRFL